MSCVPIRAVFVGGGGGGGGASLLQVEKDI